MKAEPQRDDAFCLNWNLHWGQKESNHTLTNRNDQCAPSYPFLSAMLPCISQPSALHWWPKGKEKRAQPPWVIVLSVLPSSFVTYMRMLLKCKCVTKLNKSTSVHFVQHFHCSGKKEICTYKLQNTNCVASVFLHISETVWYLHLKLSLYNINSKTHASSLNDRFSYTKYIK